MSKGLEALEFLKTDLQKYPDNSLAYAMQKEEYKIIEKEIKALEIIKNSGYISIDIMLSQNYITRKEYDLLKEVLNDEH